jgi:hypothetical protein
MARLPSVCFGSCPPQATASAHCHSGSPPLDLAEILSGPLPDVPAGPVKSVAMELREMRTPRACEVWRHPGWASLCVWISSKIPDCDPTTPGIHGVRLAALVREDRSTADRVGRHLANIARRCPADRLGQSYGAAIRQGVTAPPMGPSGDSLIGEVAILLRIVGISLNPVVWQAVSEAVDIGIDWLDRFAIHKDLVGKELIGAAREQTRIASDRRLRQLLPNPIARPLAALLLGGDQWGRRARRACGQETSLLLWALMMRHAHAIGKPEPVPQPPVVRAWATTVRLIGDALPAPEASGPDFGPTVAA